MIDFEKLKSGDKIITYTKFDDITVNKPYLIYINAGGFPYINDDVGFGRTCIIEENEKCWDIFVDNNHDICIRFTEDEANTILSVFKSVSGSVHSRMNNINNVIVKLASLYKPDLRDDDITGTISFTEDEAVTKFRLMYESLSTEQQKLVSKQIINRTYSNI
jgi:hypothetical protein